jgi:hypothetical protein
MSIEKIEELGFILVPQPPYYPTWHRATSFCSVPKTALGMKAFHQGTPGDCCGQGGF